MAKAKSKKAQKAKTQTILVTGASGFLGLHLVEVLRTQGHRVRSLSRKPSERLEPWEVDQRQGSVTSLEDCAAAVDGVDAVYHCAGAVSRDKEDTGWMHDVHVLGTRNMLAAAREAGVEQFLYVSTSGTIGVSEEDEVLDEDAEVPWDLMRGWPYYLSKAYAEEELFAAVKDGYPAKMVRPTLLLGPGDWAGSSTGDVVKFLCGDIKAALPGGVSAVDVRDVAAVLPVAMERGAPGFGYLLGSRNLALRDFLLMLEQVSGVKAPRMGMPRSLIERAGGLLKQASRLDVMGGLEPMTFEMACHYWYIDSARAVADLGWAPRALEATLRDTVEWLGGR